MKSIKKSQITNNWTLVDANDQILGRLATQIAQTLMGKNKPEFVSNLDCGDHVVVINASKIMVSGRKENNKIYYRHTGFPGGLKQANFKTMIAKKPEDVITKAVKGMLPKTKMGAAQLKKLHVFANAEHGFKAKFETK